MTCRSMRCVQQTPLATLAVSDARSGDAPTLPLRSRAGVRRRRSARHGDRRRIPHERRRARPNKVSRQVRSNSEADLFAGNSPTPADQWRHPSRVDVESRARRAVQALPMAATWQPKSAKEGHAMLRTPRSNDVHAFPHGGLRASMLIVAIALAGGARAQGFSSTQISSGVAANIPSIALAVNTANGTCYSAYTLGGGLEVFYATKPSGGSWTEEDAAVSAEEVAMTTTQFSHGNVVPHLALLGFFKSPNLSGNIMWAPRSTGGIWTYEVVDPGLDQYCFSPSITLNIANVPHIAYWGYSSDGISRLRLATRLGPNNWQIDVVDSTYGSFDDVTVRMWDVPEVLTYGRLQNGASTWEFIYARRSGSTWVTEQI